MWESYCKRKYDESNGNTTSECEKPLNPSRLFFSDVSPQSVDLALFAPFKDTNDIINCFMSKIRSDDESYQMVTSCKGLDWDNPTAAMVAAQKLILQVYYWSFGCGAYLMVRI
jgi:hypothetical protein